jgi:beta-galactosidase
MKFPFAGRLLATIATIALVWTGAVSAGESPREHLSLDAGWKFYLGDNWPSALNLAKAGASTGPASEKFSDIAWRSLDLPHDWAIELPFDKSSDTSHGYKPVGPGFPKNSVGWYRRTFELPQEDAGKRIWLTFDGVFRNATVWVNGWLVKQHDGGYYPFRMDVTDAVKFGGKNVIAVKVDASKFEGWFYEGAGIYRHVWLDKTAPVAIAPDGVFVWSQFKNNVPEGTANIRATVVLKNSGAEAFSVAVDMEVFDPNGNSVLKMSQLAAINPYVSNLAGRMLANSEQELSLDDKLKNPILWSPESPKLYKLVTTIKDHGKIVDRKETEFGIRTVGFDKDKGFLLNGQPYVLKGTCNHQDHAGVGAALPDDLQYFRIAKLKEFGCNAYRCSHNPPTPELLEACDRLGMIVMDEARLLGGDEENLRKWEDLIKRDRNHPSVAIWCVGNEEFYAQRTPEGGNAARTMQDLVKRLDPTRPVTYAANMGDEFVGVNPVIEVRGWNYHVNKGMDDYHAKHPEQPNVGTETASTVSTRGIYENDKERGYVSAYDVNFPSWASTAEHWWSFYAARPWLSGGFVWTGFDYRGEPTPYSWPCINSHFGVLDTCGFPKDNFYYYQAWWTTNTVLHLLPHWNWSGSARGVAGSGTDGDLAAVTPRAKEGQEIRVDALSNCEEVELFLNGASLGKQAMKRNSKLSWQVKYAPGVLSAKGFNGGKVVAEKKIETTGEPVAVKLTRDVTGVSELVKANGKDLAIFTVSAVDAQGREVPTAQNNIHFAIEGAGKILGVGNGDPSCHEPDVFPASQSIRSIPVSGWRWKLAAFPTKRGETAPEFAPDFDDSSWNVIKTKTDADTGELVLKEWGQTAIYRAHVKLTEEDLANPGVQIRFAGCDDNGWYYVNNQRVGESHDWEERPVFDIKKHLRPGDNVIAVGVKNDGGDGGLNPDVNVELVGKATASPWSRSLFNGLAQIIIQSSPVAGEIKLTASAEGLKPAVATIQTVAGPAQPGVQ